MKQKAFIPLALMAALALPTEAKHLTADEALQRVQSELSVHRAPSQNPLKLTKTINTPITDLEAAYIFSRPDSGGFLILSADDAEVPVLAYSDSGSFDPDNMPEAMAWWLQGFAAQVGKESTLAAAPLSRDVRQPVEPLITTKWDQKTPFNNQCPLLNGRRAVTGCVATAMAQIANYHKWPQQGVGVREYEFEFNGQSYSESFDFESTTFDWDLPDVFNWSATSEQRSSVAKLMHACGVAAMMEYGINESSSNGVAAAMGLMRNMYYDKAMSYHQRAWYTYDEWCDMIYGQVANGLPLLISGESQYGDGHQFICDGYAEGGYFHFNWGWGGLGDGYYYMYDLRPEEQGVGSNGDRYDFKQYVIIDIKPAKENTDYTPVVYTDLFYPRYIASARGNGYSFEVKGNFYSMTLSNIDIMPGLKLVNRSGKVVYVESSGMVNIPMPSNEKVNGFGNFYLRSTDLPVGDWEASPVFKTATTDWQPMHYDRTKTTAKMYLKVSSGRIDVNQNLNSIGAELIGYHLSPYSVDVPQQGDELHAGYTYNVEYKLTVKGQWWGEVRCVLLNSSSKVLDMGAPQAIDFGSASSRNVTFDLAISPSRESGNYFVGLIGYDNNDDPYFITYAPVKIEGANGSITDINWTHDPSKEYYMYHTYTFDFDISVSAKWGGNLACVLVRNNSINAMSEEQEIFIPEKGSQKVSFDVTIDPRRSSSLVPGQYEVMLVSGTTPQGPRPLGILTISPKDVPVEATSLYNSWTAANGLDKALFPGHEYSFVYDLTTDGVWAAYVYCTASDGINEVSSTKLPTQFNVGGTKTLTPTLTFGSDFNTGEYELTLFSYYEGETKVIDSRVITLVDFYADLLATYTGCTEDETYEPKPSDGDDVEEDASADSSEDVLSRDGSEDTEAPEETECTLVYAGHKYLFSYDVTADNGPWNASVFCALTQGEDSDDMLAVSEGLDLYFSTAETQSVELPMVIADTLAPGKYNLGLYNSVDYSFKLLCNEEIEVAESDGIIDIINDSDSVTYYNLQGLKVQNPTPGSVLIKVEGDKVSKVIVK